MQQIRKVKSDEIITLVLTTASSPLYNLTACSRGRPHTPAGHFLPTPVTHLTLSTLLAAMSLDALAQKPARQLGPYRTGRLALALIIASFVPGPRQRMRSGNESSLLRTRTTTTSEHD